MKKLFLKILPVLVIASILLGACSALPSTLSAVTSTPAPTLSPAATSAPSTTPAPSATSVTPPGDDVWDGIVAKNKIVVGTSLDYPPFASIDSNFQAVGFDIALIQEIGRRLDIPIDIQNFAFEGLPGALQTNQIDLAIAAISVTPERATRMSFSPVYYINETAVMARKDSPVTGITELNQLAGLRIGVQRGTTYESMVQNVLVDTGLVRKDQLLSYLEADAAVRNLVASQVDVVLTDLATAKYYSSHQALWVVGRGFDQQNLAVAMRPGTPRLEAEIDRAMEDMLADGTILGLIQKYIQNDVTAVLPTPNTTSQPTSTPVHQLPTVAPPLCVDGMRFVADVNLDDNDMKSPPVFKPGAGFVKTWRVQNSGTCTWTPDYRLVYAYGNVDAARMNGQPLSMPGNVAPGQSIDLSVTLIAPNPALTYQGFWQMENASGARFGQAVWVGITTQPDTSIPVATEQPYVNSCVVTNTGPAKSIKVHASFDAVWSVKNVSGDDWDMDSVDYKFISGTEMHEKAVYDFTQTIKDGESGKIIVDMLAPGKPGIYSATWAIVAKSKTLCVLDVTVTVIPKN